MLVVRFMEFVLSVGFFVLPTAILRSSHLSPKQIDTSRTVNTSVMVNVSTAQDGHV
jgi:hypothetical protein